MTDDLQNSIDAIFDRHEAAKQAAVAAAEKRKSQEELFVEEFLAVRAGVIRPALERVAQLVKDRGYDCEVVDQDTAQRPGGSPGEPMATLRILVERSDRHTEHPHLSDICDRLQRRVRFHESTIWGNRGGHGGPAGDAALSEVTDQLVFTKAVKLLGEVFR